MEGIGREGGGDRKGEREADKDGGDKEGGRKRKREEEGEKKKVGSKRRRTFKPSLQMAHVFQASYHGYAYQRP